MENYHAEHLLMISSDTEIIDIYKDSYMEYQNKVARLMQDTENKTREAKRLRGQACNSVLAGIDHRTHGNRSQANFILRQME